MGLLARMGTTITGIPLAGGLLRRTLRATGRFGVRLHASITATEVTMAL